MLLEGRGRGVHMFWLTYAMYQVEDQMASFIGDEEKLQAFMGTTCDEIANATENESHVGLPLSSAPPFAPHVPRVVHGEDDK